MAGCLTKHGDFTLYTYYTVPFTHIYLRYNTGQNK